MLRKKLPLSLMTIQNTFYRLKTCGKVTAVATRSATRVFSLLYHSGFLSVFNTNLWVLGGPDQMVITLLTLSTRTTRTRTGPCGRSSTWARASPRAGCQLTRCHSIWRGGSLPADGRVLCPPFELLGDASALLWQLRSCSEHVAKPELISLMGRQGLLSCAQQDI